MDSDPFLPLNRREDPFDSDQHIFKQHRIVQMIERRVQEATGKLRVAMPR
jgi:hypothetical protein